MATPKRIQDSFNVFDIDGCGELRNQDVMLLLQGVGFEDITKEELSAMCKAMDTDCSGAISYQELEKAVLRKIGQPDSPEEVWKVFNALDHDSTGRLTCQDLVRGVKKYDISLSEVECASIFAVMSEGLPIISYDVWKCVLSEMRNTHQRT